MRWFKHRHRAVLGIDISASAVKVLELSRSGEGYKVDSYGISALTQNAASNPGSAPIDGVAQAIKVALKHAGTKTRNACVAIADSVVMSKRISIPSTLTQAAIEEQVLLAADQYVPYPLDEVNLDFAVQQETNNKPKQMDVLVVATRCENVQHQVATLATAGLIANIVDVESFAIENAFAWLAAQLPAILAEQTVAIVDVGATTTTLNVLHQGRIVYTQGQRFGGKQLTENIQKCYSLSYAQAELAKKQGGLPADYNATVLEPFKQALTQKIARSLQFFASSNPGNTVDSIMLAGGCAALLGLPQWVEQNLAKPTFTANPFAAMTCANNVNAHRLHSQAPAMLTACGLALRRFD